MLNKAIFLDRDGVVNKEVNYLHKTNNFEFTNGIFNACKHFTNLDYKLIIVTNQSGIARGFYSDSDYEKLNQWMINQFKSHDILILDSFHCPHLPQAMCSCRKPKPGMLISAKNKYKISMSESWMIGDKASDMEAAVSAKISNTIFLMDSHNTDEPLENAKYVINELVEVKKIITL
jgi:D-glycero-D-manno-heptose 1,7-bisphosphate phosphatase